MAICRKRPGILEFSENRERWPDASISLTEVRILRCVMYLGLLGLCNHDTSLYMLSGTHQISTVWAEALKTETSGQWTSFRKCYIEPQWSPCNPEERLCKRMISRELIVGCNGFWVVHRSGSGTVLLGRIRIRNNCSGSDTKICKSFCTFFFKTTSSLIICISVVPLCTLCKIC